MSKPTYAYSATEVTISFCGRPLTSGYSEGEFCKVTANSEDFGSKVGTDGEVTRYQIVNDTLSIELHFKQSSASNDLLSELRFLKAVGPFYLRDRNGRSVSEAELAWIVGPPEQSWAMEPGDRVWKLATGPGKIIIGGNNLLTRNV